MADIKLFRDKLFGFVHRGGHDMKNAFPNWLHMAVEQEIWKQANDPATGKPFADVGRWLVVNWPIGPGVGIGEFALTYDECIQLCERDPKLKDLLVKHRPVGKAGGDRQSAKGKSSFDNPPKRLAGTSKAYLERRLQRDHPAIWKAYLNGEYRSARAAGIAAGFVKPTNDPATLIRTTWKKLTPKQRLAFKTWMTSN